MLYFVATPIGNLKEITERAKEVLKSVDYILCEDTRTSMVLLNEYEISKPLFSYHKFNEKEQSNSIIKDLKNGKDVALISDAGMPTISDPGRILLLQAIEEGLDYTVVSGATAFVNAFVLSGFETPLTFVGFLPSKNSDKKELLKELKTYKTTLLFYVSPHDIHSTIADLFAVFGNRKICVVRELTKKFEQVTFTTLEEGYKGVTKGEFVIVVEKGGDDDSPLNLLTVEEHLNFYINLGYQKSDAIDMVAKERNMKKSDVYKVGINIPVER